MFGFESLSQGLASDFGAAALFLAAWLFYAPVTQRLARGRGLNADMGAIRRRWMRQMTRRPDLRLLDGQLMGHNLSSASFFGSSNLFLIAAASGILFGGERSYRNVLEIPLMAHGPRLVFELKLALVVATLARGLLDFTWSIRQINYTLALIGAAPIQVSAVRMDDYADAASGVFNQALSAFNSGVRGYYFALAAAAWVFGPAALAVSTVFVTALLVFRQLGSSTARSLSAARAVLEAEEIERDPYPPPSDPQASTPTPMGQLTPVPPMPQ